MGRRARYNYFNMSGRAISPMSSEQRDDVVNALVEAALKASRVIVRDSIVPIRQIRVGEFVTQLRRELHYKYRRRNRIIHELTQTSIWHDILILRSGIVMPSTLKDLRSIVGIASLKLKEDSSKVQISMTMAEEWMSEAQHAIATMTQLGKEAELLHEPKEAQKGSRQTT